jgi:hypothetical protein
MSSLNVIQRVFANYSSYLYAKFVFSDLHTFRYCHVRKQVKTHTPPKKFDRRSHWTRRVDHVKEQTRRVLGTILREKKEVSVVAKAPQKIYLDRSYTHPNSVSPALFVCSCSWKKSRTSIIFLDQL